ncbi:DUF4339 domain-containing protein [Roseiconus lacunae]|uniref:DUF4339 domain-containing protein n=1 Tax=Roseiconus lacunae TaxID=2605694 RepID=A0ABT7PJM8_9BACT|nr:DUF4339 domain-containing protein [Roseiconus lacunae]MCD0461678.1 DUF4339 domain-containing protein [Roseiconus lacunae]MDM4016675.1 DUF4339 domain-containing protein [Roseiconus lacunae]WRQ49543.1 DUF4339 domain-containing protein [Stieleria sp. HD01]
MTPIERVYIRFRGRTIGPLAPDKVKEMVRRGQVTRMHELSADGLSWTKAEEFGNFFPRAAPAGSTAGDMAADGSVVPPGESGGAIAPNENATAQWYAHVQGEKQGPVSLDQMRLYAEAKVLKKDSLVWKNGMETWKAASEVLPELFGGKAPAGGSAAVSSPPSDDSDTSGPTGTALSKEIAENHGWILALGISLLIGCAVFFVVQILKLNEGGQKLRSDYLSASLFIVTAGAGSAVGILAIQVSMKMKAAAESGSPIATIVGAKSLSQFWMVGAIASIVWVAFVLLMLIAAITMSLPLTKVLG